jgi:hypothetical protein
MQLQDLLIDRFVEHREATAAGQEERVNTVEEEIDSPSARKERDRQVGGCRLGLAGGIQRRKPRPLLACDWASTHMLLPIGYPMGRFGPVRRVALADVVYEDRWGQTYRGL